MARKTSTTKPAASAAERVEFLPLILEALKTRA